MDRESEKKNLDRSDGWLVGWLVGWLEAKQPEKWIEWMEKKCHWTLCRRNRVAFFSPEKKPKESNCHIIIIQQSPV